MRAKTRHFVIFVSALLALAFISQGSKTQVPDSMSKSDAATFWLILSGDEKRDFDRLKSPEEKARWAKIYWKRRDPTPTTAKNERLEEYLRRVAHARTFYKSFTMTGFDDRGEVYVRYGEPAQKYVEPAGTSFAKANESWTNHHIYPGLIFDFVSDGTAYHLTDDLRKAIVLRDSSGGIGNLVEMYQSRADLDVKCAKLASALQLVLVVASDFNHRMGLAREHLAEFAGETYRIRIEAPAASYEYDYRKEPLHVALRLAQFRRPNGKVRQELYYGIPLNELEFIRVDREWTTPVEAKVAIFDSLYNTVAIDSFTADLLVPDEAAARDGFYASQFNFLLSQSAYHATIRMENAPGNRLGILQADIARPAFAFSPDPLAISDLQLSHHIVALEDSVKMQTESGVAETNLSSMACASPHLPEKRFRSIARCLSILKFTARKKTPVA